MSFSYYPPILLSLSLTPLPCTVLPEFSICALFFIKIAAFLILAAQEPSSLLKALYDRTLSLCMCGSWICTSMLVSRPISQRKGKQSEPAWVSLPSCGLCGSSLRLSRETRGFSPLLVLRGRVLGRARPICLPEGCCHCCLIVLSTEPTLFHSTVMSRSHHAALSHGLTHTNTCTYTSLRMPGPLPATPSACYCHSFLTIPNSTHGLFSVGIINFIIWIVLLTIVLIV